MPSVRVRRSQYSTLGGTQGSSPNRASIFGAWAQASPPESPVVASAAPTSADPFTPPSRPTARLRSGSLVEDHCRRQAPSLLRPDPARRSVESDRLQPSRLGVDAPNTAPSVLSVSDGRSDGISVEIMGADRHHHDDIVEHLDCIDPQVATMSNLTNAANSIFIPPMLWYSRKPVVILRPPVASVVGDPEQGEGFKDDLDRHVDDVLTRPAKIRRTLQGVWSFLKTPMGILTGIYGFCVVFWGAAIVFFLAKFINLHNADQQGFWVEVSSQVVNGLFTVTGVGLIPFRVLDSYRISRIYSYKRRTVELRRKAGLPQLFDVNDLPDPMYDPNYVHVLTDEEQADLHKQQKKFQYSQTWYRAHGTETHRSFPISTALIICCLNIGNSIFQVILCATMWSLNRFQRPAWSTGILIPASFLCGIGSAIMIAVGSKSTKRTEEVEERLKAVLANELSRQRAEGVVKPKLSTSNLSGAGTMQRVDEGVEEPPEDEKKLFPAHEVETMVDEHMTVSQVPPHIGSEKGTTA